MPRFALRMFAFLSIQTLIALIVFCYGAPKDSNHYLSAMQDKVNRLEQLSGDRLLVVGGSNVAFGIHSHCLEDVTGMPTVNLGLHAALGLEYYVECVRQHARPGDVVVLIPEYEMLIGNLQQGDSVVINQLLEQYPAARRYFHDQRGWKDFLDHDALCQTRQWLRRAVHHLRRREKPDNIYQRSSFNRHGDVIAHYGRHADKSGIKAGTLHVDSEGRDAAMTLLNELASHCETEGVGLYLAFAPLTETRYAGATDVIDNLEAALRSQLRIPLLHPIEEIVLPIDQFFDSDYHLNQVAGARRSREIAFALNRLHDPHSRISSDLHNREPTSLPR